MSTLQWFKSSYSEGEGGACLQVAARNEDVVVRDTKDVQRPLVDFPARSWEKFVAYITR